jgi:hypothetical protein
MIIAKMIFFICQAPLETNQRSRPHESGAAEPVLGFDGDVWICWGAASNSTANSRGPTPPLAIRPNRILVAMGQVMGRTRKPDTTVRSDEWWNFVDEQRKFCRRASRVRAILDMAIQNNGYGASPTSRWGEVQRRADPGSKGNA